MNAAHLRFYCLVPGCRANKDFSLITLFEHLHYHVKDKNLTSFFEYKCLSCQAFFTNKIFMFDHKRCHPDHRIEHIPCLDLDTPNNDPQLCEAFNLITTSYLRDMFAVSGQNGASSRNCDPKEPPKTSTYSCNGYEPRTPCYNDIRPRDFTNNCVNADLPRTPSSSQGNDPAAKYIANQLDGIMLSSIPEDWKQAIVSQMVPFLNGSNPFSQEAGVGRETRARDNMDSGGRDSFGSRDGPPRSGGNFNDRFETNGGGDSDRPRGGGRGGDSDRPRGSFNRGKEDHHVSDCPDPRKPRFGADGEGFSGRGGGRGRDGDRYSSRGRGGDRGGGGRGGFRGGRREADRNRSRSRSPRRSSLPARRSYSRSRSPPSNRSDAGKKSPSRDRSFSHSPQSD